MGAIVNMCFFLLVVNMSMLQNQPPHPVNQMGLAPFLAGILHAYEICLLSQLNLFGGHQDDAYQRNPSIHLSMPTREEGGWPNSDSSVLGQCLQIFLMLWSAEIPCPKSTALSWQAQIQGNLGFLKAIGGDCRPAGLV